MQLLLHHVQYYFHTEGSRTERDCLSEAIFLIQKGVPFLLQNIVQKPISFSAYELSRRGLFAAGPCPKQRGLQEQLHQARATSP